jgi:ABC-type nitrate/sulfonate/bicarbonate transport system substrate-binding protein
MSEKRQAQGFRVAIISESAGSWPVYVGLDKGFFEAEGLDVEVIFTRSSVKHLQDLKAGGIYDVGHQAVDHIVRAVEGGSDLITVFGIAKPNYSLIVSEDIHCYADLRGKKLGVDGVSTGFALLLKHMLAENGLVDGQDYELVQIGGTGERYQAVLEGKVAGALLDGPVDLIAEANGLNRLGCNLDYIPEYQGTVAATKKSYAEENKEKLERYIRGYVAASDWLHDALNKEEAVDILTRHLKVDAKIASLTYDRYIQSQTFNIRGEINLTGVSEAMKVMARTGQIETSVTDPTKYCDFHYYREALNL